MSGMQFPNKVGQPQAAGLLPEEAASKPITSHFAELRKRLIRCFIAVAALFLVIMTCWSDTLVQLLSAPVKQRGIEFVYIGLAEALTAELGVSLIAAVVFAAPVIFYNVWSFVKPALYENEKRYLLVFMGCSVLLFLLGTAFGYGVVFLSAITFFVMTGEGIATPMLSINQYIGFLFTFVLSFGIVFEIPVFNFVLCKAGVVTPDQLAAIRKYAVLAIFIVAAFLTPPDVVSQILMAVPMLALYEIGILVARAACAGKTAAGVLGK
ncbi:MAG TPA: twin-arginine translocase subunit TatC [Acidaminococcaceae bacterium]|nr:twin-arginine translocase subunit TatC [Acidaminococcaceae bacterium]